MKDGKRFCEEEGCEIYTYPMRGDRRLWRCKDHITTAQRLAREGAQRAVDHADAESKFH